jgi:putative oxidoreductase
LLEFVGGLALASGAMVELVAAVLAFEMLVRVLVIWLEGKGFPQPLPGEPALPGYEMNLMYIGCLAALVSAGAGRFSIDEWLARKLSGLASTKGTAGGP